jgi:hypothetical protein
MSHSQHCLAITIPPPDAEAALTATLRRIFPTLAPEMLAPFYETGETLYLSSPDRPSLAQLAHTLRTHGHEVTAGETPPDLQTERSLVMPHPEAGNHHDRRTVVGLGRRQAPTDLPTVITVPLPDFRPEAGGSGHAAHCPGCREALLPGIPFCPACGLEPPAAPATPHQLDIRLPDDPRRHRILSWLAQGTGLTIPQLRPDTGHNVQVQVMLPAEAVVGLTRHLAGWGAVVTAESPDAPAGFIRWGPKDAGVGLAVLLTAGLTSLPHTLGAGFWALALGGWALAHRAEWRQWKTGGLPTIDPDAALRLAGPLPADLLADVRAALAETAGSGLQPAVRRTLTVTAGICQAILAHDAVGHHLWQDLEPQLRAVVSGILGLVRRGRQVERFLKDHGEATVTHEIKRLERLLARTSDAVARGHYESALASAEKTRQRRQDALVAAERLGSQLLVLLHGLADVQATVAMSGIDTSGQSPLVTQLQHLQRDVSAADAALQELLG